LKKKKKEEEGGGERKFPASIKSSALNGGKGLELGVTSCLLISIADKRTRTPFECPGVKGSG
jgi:hypothetical protein